MRGVSTVSMRPARWTSLLALLSCWALLFVATVADAQHGEPHGAFKVWAIGSSLPHVGLDPMETLAFPLSLKPHVGAPAMVTSMVNVGGDAAGLLYWNPETDLFKGYAVTSGPAFAIDIDRSAPVASDPPDTVAFGGGDVWATVYVNGQHSPYVHIRGRDWFRRWNVGALNATGIRVNPSTGKVYFGDFSSPGRIFELDPATDGVRVWHVGSNPVSLALDGDFVWATAVADPGSSVPGSSQPDQIIRLDTATNEVKRWKVPGGGFQASVTFGLPNSIARDDAGKIWFTETASNQIGRLNPSTNVINEYRKSGIGSPEALALTGSGSALRGFFTEAEADKVSVIRPAVATPSLTRSVSPSSSTVPPSTLTATPVDFVVEPETATIAPSTSRSAGVDPQGIVRFPIPSGSDKPTGITAGPANRVFGSIDGTDELFQFDLVPPKTTITRGPDETTQSRSAAFRFVADQTADFRCSLDDRPLRPCEPPKVYSDLKPGDHTFRVQAIDLAGTVDPTPATYRWTIEP